MPADVNDARLMQISTDFPLDKVILLRSGSFTLPASTTGYLLPIPHPLGFSPLCGGNWSFVPDFSSQYEFSIGTFPSTSPGVFFDQVCNVFSNSTSVFVSADNNTATPRTVYYRIFGLQPSNDDSDIDPIASSGDNFIINSDYNYTKVLLDNFVDLPSTTSLEVTVTIQHTAGVIPQVMGWVTYDTFDGANVVPCVHPVGTSNSASENVTLLVGNIAIAFQIPPFVAAHRAYYRVYLDE